jgi:hypothetical protein
MGRKRSGDSPKLWVEHSGEHVAKHHAFACRERGRCQAELERSCEAANGEHFVEGHVLGEPPVRATSCGVRRLAHCEIDDIGERAEQRVAARSGSVLREAVHDGVREE